MPISKASTSWDVARQQFSVVGVFLFLLALILLSSYHKDRQQEWRLREEQASHRLELAYELITRDFERTRADILYLANQHDIRSFLRDSLGSRDKIESEFGNFLEFKKTHQQIRLVNIDGRELVRVDFRGGNVETIPEQKLQNKKDRYYIQESAKLLPGEIFVSEFDLNQERGVIEQPLVPVIRFVTPVCDESGKASILLVANYLGGPLLRELRATSLPGQTFLIRQDGQYLLGPKPDDSWGWLLGHGHTFSSQFPAAWKDFQNGKESCFLTLTGAFAFRKIQLQQFGRVQPGGDDSGRELVIVSFLPAAEVFATSNRLITRFGLLALVTLLPLLLLTRLWAVGSVRRRQQNQLISESEKKLRELSSRLVRIQEEERRAISREIHDQLGQQVTAINLDLKLAKRDSVSESVRNQLQHAVDESELLLNTLHDFATRIRPVELDDFGLHDAVESHLEEFRKRSAIEVRFESNTAGLTLPPIIEENVYRLVQESMNNILKHADATHASVQINLKNTEDEDELLVEINDDGIGTENDVAGTPNARPTRLTGSASERTKLGILGMRERVDLMGGEMDFVSGPGQGTAVSVRVPIRKSAADANGRSSK